MCVLGKRCIYRRRPRSQRARRNDPTVVGPRPRPRLPRVLTVAALVLLVGQPPGGAVAPVEWDASLTAGAGAVTVTVGAGDVVQYARSVVSYQAPVSPLRIVRGFSPPATKYGPGHLGVDLASRAGAPVRSTAAGVVSFVGMVAGRGVVVVAHDDGVRTEYEPVTPSVHTDEPVVRGQQIAVVSGLHAGCAQVCLHWGARRGETYLNPLSLLRPLGVVRLLPWLRSS